MWPTNVAGEKRSLIMAAVHSEDSGPERSVRKIVHGLGYRYRLHGGQQELPLGLNNV